MRFFLFIMMGWMLVSPGYASVFMSLPGVEEQNDSWSCGINSATRMLRAYGHNVSYEDLKIEFSKLSFQVPTQGRFELDIGLGGKALAERIQRYEPSAQWQDYATFPFVKYLLAEGKPVGALLYLGSDTQEGLTIPSLHWVVLVGFDDERNIITYYDTSDGFEGPSHMSYDSFLSQWQWNGWDIWSGEAARSFVSQAAIFFSKGQNGIFWVDRPLPNFLNSRSQHAPILASVPQRSTIKLLSFDKQGVKACSRDHAFELAKDECRRSQGVDSVDKVLVMFPKTENYWLSQERDGVFGARKCMDHVREAFCATAYQQH